MTKLSLTFAAAPYDRIQPIFDGRVAVEGCELNCFPMESEEAFARAYSTRDFDVTELSASSHILTTARGDAHYVGIPAFLSRVFRHGAIAIRTDRGIRGPEDLRGKTVGVPEYQMTAALWARGLLSDEYGVRTRDIRWRNGGLEEPGRRERTPLALPPEIALEAIPAGATLSAMLREGALDAVIASRTPSCLAQGAPNVARLFPDVRTAEEAYYRKTGMFPIMHLVGVRRSLVAAHPWLGFSLLKAFAAARAIALRALKQSSVYHAMLPWLPDDVARVEAVMGREWWPYGVAANAKELAAMLRWSVEQGLSPREARIDELFAPGTLEAVKI